MSKLTILKQAFNWRLVRREDGSVMFEFQDFPSKNFVRMIRHCGFTQGRKGITWIGKEENLPQIFI